MRARGSKANAKADDDELVRRLAARLARAEIEALVVSNALRSGAPITRAEPEPRLPEPLQPRDVQRLEVRAGASREGTGLFDALDDVLLARGIVSHLKPLARVLAVSCVCKAWRVRGSVELFCVRFTSTMLVVVQAWPRAHRAHLGRPGLCRALPLGPLSLDLSSRP